MPNQAYFPSFFMWLQIRCPNKRRGYGSKICGCTLKIVDGITKANFREIIYCNACGAQVILNFSETGSCYAEIPQNKKIVPTELYPVVASGEYVRALHDSNS